MSLTLAYLLPVLLLAVILLRAQLAQWHKAALLALLPLFYVLHYTGISNLSGWPTTQALPERFILLGQQVTQPDKRSGTPGHIHMWVQTLDGRRSRLYVLPYSRQLHQKLVTAEARAGQGLQQVGIRHSTNKGSQPQAGSERGEIDFEDRQRNRLPAKDP